MFGAVYVSRTWHGHSSSMMTLLSNNNNNNNNGGDTLCPFGGPGLLVAHHFSCPHSLSIHSCISPPSPSFSVSPTLSFSTSLPLPIPLFHSSPFSPSLSISSSSLIIFFFVVSVKEGGIVDVPMIKVDKLETNDGVTINGHVFINGTLFLSLGLPPFWVPLFFHLLLFSLSISPSSLPYFIIRWLYSTGGIVDARICNHTDSSPPFLEVSLLYYNYYDYY